MGRSGEKGILGQFIILLIRNVELFINDPKKVLSTFGFPVLIALVIIMVSRDKFFDTFGDTKAGLFTILCAGIYVGMFNSLTTICKERKIIKREVMTNMSLFSYILALSVFQGVICLLQCFVFMTIYWMMMDFTNHALIFTSRSFFDYFITLYLVIFASDLMGMVVSASVKNSEMANLVAPIIIIAQLVLCGVLFDLEGIMDTVSNFTISRWGMEAFGSIADLNGLSLAELDGNTVLVEEFKANEAYTATSEHVLETWTILGCFIAVLFFVCTIILRQVEKDTR